MKRKWGAAISLLICTMAIMNLSGCGGDDGGGAGGGPTPSIGVFVDSPVQGLNYSGPHFSGVTDSAGEFKYLPGDFVSFSIGSLSIGVSHPGAPMLTPFSTLSNTPVATLTGNEGPVSLARLLLTLNTTPGTGKVTLPSPLPALPQLTSSASWSDPSSFETAMQGVGLTPIGRAEAVAHLKAQFAIWGSWTTAGTASRLQVLTFLPNGRFILADDDDPLVSGGADGMEQGTYRWNATTNELTYVTAVNTDGTGGLSALTPGPYSFIINSSGNAAVLRFGPNVNDTIAYTRVIDQNNSLIGAWSITQPTVDQPGAILTLFVDGTFTVASDAIDTDPAGMERGTYVHDGTLHKITFTTTVDTNGAGGLNAVATLPAVETVGVSVIQSGTMMHVETEPNVFLTLYGVAVP